MHDKCARVAHVQDILECHVREGHNKNSSECTKALMVCRIFQNVILERVTLKRYECINTAFEAPLLTVIEIKFSF